TAELNLEYDLNDAIMLKTGLHYKKFEFETFGARISSEGGAAGAISTSPEYIMSYDSGLGVDPVWLIPNRDAIADDFGIYSNTGTFEISTENRLTENYSSGEETQGAYVQMVFNTELGETVVRGDVGVRYVNTDQTSTAWATIGGDPELITADHS